MIRAVLYNFKKRRKAEESKESNESWRACALSEHVYVCQWTRNATVYKQHATAPSIHDSLAQLLRPQLYRTAELKRRGTKQG